MESMTFGYGAGVMPDGFSESVLSNQQASDCLIPMGITSENVASDYNISREVQDDFAAKSFQKAAAAQKAGKFKDEIVPLKAKWIDPKSGEEKIIVVDHDDGVRDGVTKESLGKLKPAFKADGSTHAGTSALSIWETCSPIECDAVRSRVRLASLRRCRGSPARPTQRGQASRSAHRRQVRRCRRCGRASPDHGRWPSLRYPEGSREGRAD